MKRSVMFGLLVMICGLIIAQLFAAPSGLAQGAEITAEPATPALTNTPIPTAIMATPTPTQFVPTLVPTSAEPVAPGSQIPSNVSIMPEAATLTGAGSIEILVSYADADGDVVRFDWEVVETDAEYFALPDGLLNQAINGTEIPVTMYCFQPNFTAEIELTVIDAAGNASEPVPFTLICNDPLPVPGSGMGEMPAPTPTAIPTTVPTATPSDPGSKPVIIAIEPQELFLTEDSSAIVNVTYEDVDGDAERFIWIMDDTDALEYDLPEGVFDQSVIGTEIPALFFCTTPGFFADISLLIMDKAGNLSDPYPLRLECR